ncbi:glutaredoxin family protein [Paenibacillus sp. Marseille-Q4541]|uniref:glutaredoxin family protein n=1 Tax=Paenibacillus sp. Marseille-Q4541 TaxID=2831522 RepID=UPI001BA5C54E|nr:glutaredoxin family protein [Paenibacillus sp. Marseille-Q4541]
MNVEVYTTPTCEDCRNFKKFLNENQIAYTEFSIADHPDHADELFNRTGKRLVPTIFIDNEVFFGFVFNREVIEKKLLS